MRTLEDILTALEFGATILGSVGPTPVAAGAKLADYYLQIAQAAVRSHEAITGQPLDLTKLHQIAPV